MLLSELSFDEFASNIESSPIVGKIPIIVITGPICSGKESVGRILHKEYGYPNFTYSDALRERAAGKGLTPPYDRRVLTDESAMARKQYGNDAVTKLALYSLTLRYLKSPFPGASIDGLRRIEEATVLQTVPLIRFWWIEADQNIRWERLRVRARPGDPTTWEEFLNWDHPELTSMLPIKEMAAGRDSSVMLNNNGDEENLRQMVLKSLLS